MKFVAASLLLVVTALLLAPNVFAEKGQASPVEVKIETARGAVLEGVYHAAFQPNGTAVVIAPGGGYHKDLPLIKQSAERLSMAGFHVLRFDWAYFTAKANASDDLKVEQEDLEAAIASIRKTDGVEKVIVAGKSLGSLVALNRAGEKHDDLAGLALLTFPIHNSGDPSNMWVTPADIDKAGCPTMIAVGDSDGLAHLGPLYELIAQTERPAPIVIAPGNHGFNDPADKQNQARTDEHLDVVIDALVLYCERWAE